MILSTSPVIARFLPTTGESSRAESGAVSGESSQVAAVQDGQQPESGEARAPSPTDRVNPASDSVNIQQTRNAKDQAENIGLDEAERHVLEQLKSRDREVRAHEAAHLATAGSHATSGASFSYQRGPDGQLYAIGGEVGVSLSKVAGDPQATLEKAEQVRAAALAPAQPSSQDQAIAARASQLAAEAHRDIAVAEIEGNAQVGSVQAGDDTEEAESNVATANNNPEQAYKEVSEATNDQAFRLLDVQA